MFTKEEMSFLMKLKNEDFKFISKPNPFTVIGYKNKDEFINNQETVVYSQAFNYFETEQQLNEKHKFDFLKPSHLYNIEQLFQDVYDESKKEQQTHRYAYAFENLKKNSHSFTVQYICNLVMNTEHPEELLENLMKSNFYPYEIKYDDCTNLEDYFNNDVRKNNTVDKKIRNKSYTNLTVEDMEIVCKLYFDYCLKKVLVEFKSYM